MLCCADADGSVSGEVRAGQGRSVAKSRVMCAARDCQKDRHDGDRAEELRVNKAIASRRAGRDATALLLAFGCDACWPR